METFNTAVTLNTVIRQDDDQTKFKNISSSLRNYSVLQNMQNGCNNFNGQVYKIHMAQN